MLNMHPIKINHAPYQILIPAFIQHDNFKKKKKPSTVPSLLCLHAYRPLPPLYTYTHAYSNTHTNQEERDRGRKKKKKRKKVSFCHNVKEAKGNNNNNNRKRKKKKVRYICMHTHRYKYILQKNVLCVCVPHQRNFNRNKTPSIEDDRIQKKTATFPPKVHPLHSKPKAKKKKRGGGGGDSSWFLYSLSSLLSALFVSLRSRSLSLSPPPATLPPPPPFSCPLFSPVCASPFVVFIGSAVSWRHGCRCCLHPIHKEGRKDKKK
ncbi:hypothetical protein TCSYLVIO_000418 [Trypanosoma cruzi]|nr:hypothetical protein TCSYLVIO_000418 [Trypanosoma cruzi]